jgi:hypothetical protein
MGSKGARIFHAQITNVTLTDIIIGLAGCFAAFVFASFFCNCS